ncbi:MAG: phosphatidylserine decarboxylase [bacterium]
MVIVITLQELSLKFLCRTKIGSVILKKLVKSNFSVLVGKFLDSKYSKILLLFKNVDLTKFEKNNVLDYTSYNDFFIRKSIVPEKIFKENGIFAPASGYLSIFYSDTDFMVKNIKYSIYDLLQDHELACEFQDSYVAIIRITTAQEHRYTYAATGNLLRNTFIDGILNSVHPIAAEKNPVYATNKRNFSLIETKHMGKIIQMEVGALCVGKIINYQNDGLVLGGTEKGYFAYGGSSIVLIVKKENVNLSCDKVYEKFVNKGFQIFEEECK